MTCWMRSKFFVLPSKTLNSLISVSLGPVLTKIRRPTLHFNQRILPLNEPPHSLPLPGLLLAQLPHQIPFITCLFSLLFIGKPNLSSFSREGHLLHKTVLVKILLKGLPAFLDLLLMSRIGPLSLVCIIDLLVITVISLQGQQPLIPHTLRHISAHCLDAPDIQ